METSFAESIFFSPENSSNIELGQKIRNKIETLANTFLELDDQEKTIQRSKKSIILEMADNFERLHYLGEYPFPINNICSSIYHYLQRKGFSISDRYIQIILKENAPQYVNTAYQRNNMKNTSTIDIKIQQDILMEAVQTLKTTDLSILKTEQIQDLIPSLYETVDQYEEYAKEHNITPAPAERSQEAHYDSEDNDPYKEHIPCGKPDPRSTSAPLAEATIQCGESMMRCSQTIINTGKMMKAYPPDENDKEMEVNAVIRVIDWRTFWDALTEALKAGTDRKYRRSILQWLKIAHDEDAFGKHAACSKNAYLAKFRDKDGNIKEEIRKLTREQVGDKAPKVRELTATLRKTMPAVLDWIFWAEDYLNAWTSGLSILLHDKLEDRSLR